MQSGVDDNCGTDVMRLLRQGTYLARLARCGFVFVFFGNYEWIKGSLVFEKRLEVVSRTSISKEKRGKKDATF